MLPSYPSSPNKIRLHGMQWRVDLIQTGAGYVRELLRGNKRSLWGVTVMLFPFHLEFYSTPECVFYGESENVAMAASVAFWDRFAKRLETDLDVLLLKDRSNNWTLVKSEWATEGSDVGRRAAVEGETWRFFAREDGKLWFSCDASKLNAGGGFEHETHHARTAKSDSEKVNRMLDEVRSGSPSFSELSILLREVLLAQRGQAEATAMLQAHVIAQLPPSESVEPVVPKGWRPPYVG